MKGLLLIFFIVLGSIAYGQSDNQEEEVRLLQVSLLPSIPPSGGVYHMSLNLFAGYNNGIRGVELGSFVNVNDGMVKGVQLGGFTNITHGSVIGMQGSGFTNISSSYVKGVQTSGFYNHSRDLQGVQTSGFTNVVIGMVKGSQVSGFANVTTQEVNGVQIAGFANYAGDVRGVQLSGFANRARKLNGVQVGIVNIADTVERGATVGLVNIVKKGMMAIELENNDILDVNASFKSGTSRLYGIVSIGRKLSSDEWWGIGAGFGTELTFSDKLFTGIELTSYSMQRDNELDVSYLLNRMSLNIGYKPFEKIAVISGPSISMLVFDDEGTDKEFFHRLGNNPFYEKELDQKQLKAWIGYRIAVRF
jgi:hypothetical protein